MFDRLVEPLMLLVLSAGIAFSVSFVADQTKNAKLAYVATKLAQYERERIEAFQQEDSPDTFLKKWVGKRFSWLGRVTAVHQETQSYSIEPLEQRRNRSTMHVYPTAFNPTISPGALVRVSGRISNITRLHTSVVEARVDPLE